MNTLKKPYEISIWDTASTTNGPVEKKFLVIGSNKMKTPGRVLEPQLTINTNGTKKLTFKMYKKYLDPRTGERVDNTFSNHLFNERKVKLYYEDKWYDFIVKNIQETSTNFLYVYQLEDALVSELSKNGFGVILDSELGSGGMGTSKQLADYALSGTDWKVSELSEVPVQKIEDSLVYLQVSYDEGAKELTATRLLDQTDNTKGVGEDDIPLMLKNGDIILAFYSHCTGKPYRFQFIYLPRGYEKGKVLIDENRIIKEKNCQYYLEVDTTNYANSNELNYTHYELPKGLKVYKTSSDIDDDSDSTVSIWYRGERYGFSAQSEYLPQIQKHVEKFVNVETNEECYGYVHTEYNSPELLENFLTNTEFDGTSGWGSNGATLSVAYGKFEDKKFVSALEVFEQKGNYTSIDPYLKITTKKGAEVLLLNTGPRDNRGVIGNMPAWSSYHYEVVLLNSKGEPVNQKGISVSLGEYTYKDGLYEQKQESALKGQSSLVSIGSSEEILTVTNNPYNKETFKKKSQGRFGISFTVPTDEVVEANAIDESTGGTSTDEGTTNEPIEETTNANEVVYYLKTAGLYRAIKDSSGKLIKRGDPREAEYSAGSITHEYRYFSKKAAESATSLDQLYYLSVEDKPAYSKYKPIYNSGAEAIRNVNIKESNYFNILQTIAETFNQWLEFDIGRDEHGAIISKKVLFKNYISNNNHFGFKYGVNLQDIQRTYESNKIVNKLIVRNNNNELAQSGSCMIERSPSNPTGENYIYNFSYYFNRGLMDKDEYLELCYSTDGQKGPDVSDEDKTYNLNGYYNRIKVLNEKLRDENNTLNNMAADLSELSANYQSAQAQYNAATAAMEEQMNTYAGFTPLFPDNMTRVILQPKLGEITFGAFAGSGRKTQILTVKNGDSEEWRTYEVKVIPAPIAPMNLYFCNSLVNDEEVTLGKDKIQSYMLENITKEVFTITIRVAASNFSSLTDEEKKIAEKYAIDSSKQQKSAEEAKGLSEKINSLKSTYEQQKAKIDKLLIHKKTLNSLFYKRYSAFIQEGTWQSEEYVDDDKYYIDALSVMYNSCYPQVAYSINVLQLNDLPNFSLGDKTFIEDEEFFGVDKDGNPIRTEIIVTEKVDNLEEPEKNAIHVQNFKNEFQDLFQKITATVQQTQYRSGAYEKGAALAEANAKKKGEFLQEALSDAEQVFSVAGQQSVTIDDSGINIVDLTNRGKQIKMVGGAIMISKPPREEEEEVKWSTAMTADGIAASVITSGSLNTGQVSIMNGKDATFKWDSTGLNAFDYKITDGIISGIDTGTFVRFDRFGIYGVKNADAGWVAENIDDVQSKANFALTWEGLKVQGEDNVVAKIGKEGSNIINITDGTKSILSVSNKGNLTISGSINGSNISSSTITGSTFTNTHGTFSVDWEGNIKGAKITGGTIGIGGTAGAPNFAVDENGNVTLKGNITWGNNGPKERVTIYYNSDSSTAPGKPEYNGTGNLPSENGISWTKTPTGVSSSNKYEYISYQDLSGGNYVKDGWSTPALWAKYGQNGSNGSDASVTWYNIWSALSALNTNLKDGIYRVRDSSGSYIGINASAIRTGALIVGSDANDQNAIFYANIANEEVKIAGWQVSKTALYTGDNASSPSVYLGSEVINGQKIGQTMRDNLIFKAGTNFGVDSNGNLYAESGNISRLTINNTGIVGTAYAHATDQTIERVNVGFCPGNQGTGLYYATSGGGQFFKDGFSTNTNVISLFVGTESSPTPPPKLSQNGTCDALFMVFADGTLYAHQAFIKNYEDRISTLEEKLNIS